MLAGDFFHRGEHFVLNFGHNVRVCAFLLSIETLVAAVLLRAVHHVGTRVGNVFDEAARLVLKLGNEVRHPVPVRARAHVRNAGCEAALGEPGSVPATVRHAYKQHFGPAFVTAVLPGHQRPKRRAVLGVSQRKLVPFRVCQDDWQLRGELRMTISDVDVVIFRSSDEGAVLPAKALDGRAVGEAAAHPHAARAVRRLDRGGRAVLVVERIQDIVNVRTPRLGVREAPADHALLVFVGRSPEPLLPRTHARICKLPPLVEHCEVALLHIHLSVGLELHRVAPE
mmetsp:Transcript_8952/g.22395  ORF Transcript_8952/g.22395 Transcript_8952/m.22395 type:complete len:283 (-) Transcript_8952:93-941(-)